MTATEKARITELERQVAALTGALNLAQSGHGNNWQPFGAFTAENRMSRTRLNTLIASGKIIADKVGRIYLYKWAA